MGTIMSANSWPCSAAALEYGVACRGIFTCDLNSSGCRFGVPPFRRHRCGGCRSRRNGNRVSAGRMYMGIDGQKTLVAPATVLNFGMAKNWEAVFEGRLKHLCHTSGPTSLHGRRSVSETRLASGVLQDQAGPSIATEFGVLLPDSIGDSRFGASVAGNHFTTVGLGHGPLEYRRSRSRATSTRTFSRALS